jgi:putative transposase
MEHWPHAPAHRVLVKGIYMVTAATYFKTLHFQTEDRLQFLHDSLLLLANKYQWKLQAWAVFANHYHFIAQSPDDPTNLAAFLSNLHTTTASYANKLDATPNRNVWYQYWDNHLTYPYSYFARLKYVNQNPVRHGLVNVATHYPWCSAAWIQKTSPPSFYNTISRFKTDNLNIVDEF